MRYRIEGGALRVGPGVILGLTDEQARPRAHRLNRIDAGYAPTEVVEFKIGEIVEVVSGSLGKSSLATLIELDEAGNTTRPMIAPTTGRRAAR